MSSSPSVLTREAGTSSPATRLSRKRPSLAHLLIALAVVLAFGLNYLALQSRDATVEVAVVDADLSAGSVFTPSAIRLESVAADLPGLESLVAESDLGEFDGWVVDRAIGRGELLSRSALVAPASHAGLRLMSIPVSVEHAAGASITAGDTVDVISVVDGTPDFVARSLEVVQVAPSDQGALSIGQGYYLVVAVDAEQALALAAAIDSGSVDVLRSTGAEPLGGEES